jgi:hypothetical protein
MQQPNCLLSAVQMQSCRFLVVYALFVFGFAVFPMPVSCQRGDTGVSEFRWIHPDTDPKLWQEIMSAFRDELAPDQSQRGLPDDYIYRYKYLQKVGVLRNSALVIIGHQPARQLTNDNSWDFFSSVYNFDLATHRKSVVDHGDLLWQWKFRSLATFGPSQIPDITFNFLTCTECEPDTMFNSLYYEETISGWRLRVWGDGKTEWWAASDGLVVDSDLSATDGAISYDCAYGAIPSGQNGYQDLAIRCKFVSIGDDNKVKIDDATLLYSSVGGEFKAEPITDAAQSATLTHEICKQKSRSLLCSLPEYLIATAKNSAALQSMFPNTTPKSWDPVGSPRPSVANGLKASMSISEIVEQYGLPDELGIESDKSGKTTDHFIYHEPDGALLDIACQDLKHPAQYVRQIHTDRSYTFIISPRLARSDR